jgi:transposase
MRPQGTAEELERRRRRAVSLLEDGHSLSAVARMVGAAPSAVYAWREKVRARGADALTRKPVPGRPLKLTTKQRARLPKLLLRGACAYGYRTDLWTLPRIAAVIREEFQVAYHPCHVSRVLSACGWSCQQPARRALERDEAAIAHWKRYKWRAIKKKPAT